MTPTSTSTRVPPGTRAVIYLLLASLLNTYAGGYLYAAELQRTLEIRTRNQKALRLLNLPEDLSLDAVQSRRTQARAQIAQTRAADRARQATGLRQLQTTAPRIRDAQLPFTLQGLSQAQEQLVETLRPFYASSPSPTPLATPRAATRAEAERLFFLRETLRTFTQLLGDADTLEARALAPRALAPRTVLRTRQILEALEPLGPDAVGINLDQVPGLARATLSLLEGFTREDEARHRLSKGRGLPSPRFAGVDPLSGRPKQAPQQPISLKPRTEPLEPLSDQALLQSLIPEGQRPELLGLHLLRTADAGASSLIADPTAADLASTPDIPFTPELQAKAEALGGDPVRLYDYVLRDVRYRLYAGSLHGSQGTLEGGEGNDVDQASLLIGLLRISGIPARYETGTARIPIAQVPGLTGIQDPATAASVLTTQGIPATLVYSGSQPVELKLQRTWVRAQLPYTNYRGSRGTTQSGGAPQWVALDPAFETLQLEQQVNLIGKASFDVDAFVSASTQQSPRAFFEDALRAYVAQSGTRCETLDQAQVKRIITAAEAELLPVTLPYVLAGNAVGASALTASQRYQATVEALDSWGYPLFSKTLSLPELYGKRLSMTFPSGTGISSASKGTVKPTLAVDSTILMQGAGVSVGTELPVNVGIKGPNRSITWHDHTLTAGGTYTFSAQAGPVPDARVAQAEAARQELIRQGASQAQQDLATAHAAGLSYHQSLVRDDDALYALEGWLHFTELEAMTGADMSPIYLWGLPYGAERAGYVIDAETLFYSAPLKGTRTASIAASLAERSGYNASYHEHALWERVVGLEALSATNILQLSRAQGQSVYFLSSTAQFNAIQSTLAQPSSVISDVTSALASGDEVVIAQRPITKGGKTVSGYVLFDPDTGAGRYLINSTLNGGVTLEGLMAALSEAASLLGFGVRISSMANVAEGSLSDDAMYLTVFAHGRPHVIGLAYHSQQDQAGNLGMGWGWTFGEQLFVDPSGTAIKHLTPEAVLVPYVKSTDGSWSGPAGSTDVLSQTSSGYSLRKKDGRTLAFDLQGRFSSWTDRHGNQILLERSAAGAPTRLVTAQGTSLLTLTTNTEGQITRMQDGLSRTLLLDYTAGKLTQVTDPRGNLWRYSYGAGPLLLGKIGGDGTDIAYGFDGAGRLASYTTPTGGQGFFAFDHVNRISVWNTPTQGENLYQFDADGRLLQRVDAVGNQTSFQYQAGYLSQVVDARGGVTRLEYDARGNLIDVTDPDGSISTTTFDGQDRATSHTENGATETWTFDDTQHVITHVDVDGSTEVVQTTPTGQVLSFDRDGATATYRYDALGNLIQVDEPEGATTTFTRDVIGRVKSLSSSDGTSLSVAYDPGDKPAQISLPNGATYSASYSPYGQLQTMTDPSGVTVAYAYTGPYLMSTTDAFGRIQRFERDGAGQIVRQVDAQGNTTAFTFDPAGRLVALTDVYGQSTELGYCADASSAPCDEIDRFGNLTQRTLDARGRVSRVTTALGTTTYEYATCASCTNQSRISAVVNALGERTEYAYDARGRLLQLTDALGQHSAYAYDGRGRLRQLTDASGALTTYQRDGRGQLERLIDALNRTTWLTYDQSGHLLEKLDAQGQTTTYEYDVMGLITREAFSDGTSRTFTYDVASRLTRATSEAADIAYTYGDPLGRVTRMTNHTLGEGLELQYDPVTTQRSALIRPDGTQTYRYDRYGQLIATTLPDGQLLRMRYDAYGRKAETLFPNGLTQKEARDSFGRLTSRLLYAQSGLLVGGETYTYDALSRRLSAVDHTGARRSYQYDALGRLIQETQGTQVIAYTYDEVGNRIAKSQDGVVTTTYTYDAAHQLESSVEGGITTTYTYSENGWLESKTTGTLTTSFVYDPSGQLLETWAGGVRLARYDYDAQGRRVAWEDDRGLRHILYDQEDAVLELDDAGQAIRGFVHGPGLDEPLAQLEYQGQASTFFYHSDAQGSVSTVSGAGGGIVQRLQYSAFGEQTSSGVATAAFSYQGRPYDPASGLYDLRARQLDPRLGRFTSVDPLTPAALELPDSSLAGGLTRAQVSEAGMLNQPQWMNPFSYAGNDPVNLQDTLGQFILCDSQPSAAMSWLIGAGMVGIGIFVAFLGGLILAIAGLLLAIWSYGCQLNMIRDAEGLSEQQRELIRAFALLIFVLTAVVAIAGIWMGAVGVFVAFALLITFYTIVMGLFIDVMIGVGRWTNRRAAGP